MTCSLQPIADAVAHVLTAAEMNTLLAALGCGLRAIDGDYGAPYILHAVEHAARLSSSGVTRSPATPTPKGSGA